MTTEQKEDWTGEAVAEVIYLLRDDRMLREISMRLIEAHGSIDAAALELEALAAVAAAARTPYHSIHTKEVGIDATYLGPYLYPHVRYIYNESDSEGNVKYKIEHVIKYNVYLRIRFVGDYYIPVAEFVFINDKCFSGCAELLVSIIPAGLPARDPLRATRRVVWSAAK